MKHLLLVLSLGIFVSHALAMDATKEQEHDTMQTQKIAEMQAKMEEERIKFLKQYYPDMNISK